MPSIAIEQPLGLTLEIMRLRSFARMWREVNRERGEDEEVPTGPMADWVRRVQAMRNEDALADVRAIFGR